MVGGAPLCSLASLGSRCHPPLASLPLMPLASLGLLLALLLALHLCMLLSLYASCASVWLRREVEVCGLGGLGGLPL